MHALVCMYLTNSLFTNHMPDLTPQVTQLICSSGLCVQGVGINYHNRNLVVSLDSNGMLAVHADGAAQGRGVAQSLAPTGVSNCALTVTWTKDTSLMVSVLDALFVV